MSEWKEYKLGDVASVQTGPFGSQLHQKDYVIAGTPIITVEHLGDNRITYQNLPKVSDEDKQRLKKYHLQEGDVVFSRVGSVDRRALVTKKEDGWLFSGRCLRVRGNDKKAIGAFLSYYFGQESFKEYVRRIAVGATMPSINTTILSEIVIKIPDLPTQTAIAEILSSLDDKIELNNKINQELETLAQTLFKQWFIDFEFPNENGEPYKSSGGEMVDSELGEIPKGWEVKTLDDILTVKGGTTPSTKESIYWDGDIYWTSPRDLSNLKSPLLLDTEKKITPLGLKKISSGLLPKGTLLLSSRAPIGYLAITDIETAINQGYIAINGKNGFSNLFILCWLKSNMNSVIERANGSTFLEISKSNFKQIKIVIPSVESQNNFTNQFELMFEQIRVNTIEINELTNLRDTLLPKLISGELEINEISN